MHRIIDDSALGRPVASPDNYAPDVLFPIARSGSRELLALASPLPFSGWDIWNAWELTWQSESGCPQLADCELRVPADSPNLVESKSLKLYLNSFAMSRFSSAGAVAATIRSDVARAAGADVEIHLRAPGELPMPTIDRLPGLCIDDTDVPCDRWEADASLLRTEPAVMADESLHSHLLRSLCPVTGQPDTGSVLIRYQGPRIDPGALLRYIVSFRRHQDFHEACVERMFRDIRHRCAPASLTVYARYQRRGGIDINPYRSTDAALRPPNLRLWRQ